MIHPPTPEVAASCDTCLCDAFSTLSAWTWQMLEAAAEFEMPFHEETLTDLLLLQLAARCKGRIKVVPFTKRAEAANGADWEWWFCDWPHGLGFRIQAKRLFADGWKFRSLVFSRKTRSQTDTLIAEAATDRLIPLFCLYVFQSRKYHSKTLPIENGQGCLLVDAHTVGGLRSKRAQKLLPHTSPWQHLVCHPAGRSRSLSEIAQYASVLTNTPGLRALDELPCYVRPFAIETKRSALDARAGEQPRSRPHSARGMVIVQV